MDVLLRTCRPDAIDLECVTAGIGAARPADAAIVAYRAGRDPAFGGETEPHDPDGARRRHPIVDVTSSSTIGVSTIAAAKCGIQLHEPRAVGAALVPFGARQRVQSALG